MTASILIVDDEPGIRDMLRWELDGQGYEVEAASGGAEALERVGAREFDVVISDVRMPDVNGLEVLRTTKSCSPATEVVIITGQAELRDAVDCVRGGAFDFVQKPFELPEILATLARAMEQRRLRSTLGLFEASRAILSSRDPKRLPGLIVELTMTLMEADDVSLMLPDPQGRLYVACSHGLPDEVAAGVRLAMGDRIAGQVALTREPALLVNGMRTDARLAGLLVRERVHSSIVYPLVSGERLVGVLNMNRAEARRPFRRPDLDRAGVLASQILLALENALLFKTMLTSERLASMGQLAASIAHEITSPLTHLLGIHELLTEDVDLLERLAVDLAGGTDPSAVQRAWAEAGGPVRVEAFRQSFAEIGESAMRIRDVAQDMRSLARIDRDRPTVIDVNQAIRSALRVAVPSIKRAVAVHTRFGAEVDIVAHTGRLSQVFINLLVNAAQAIAAQGRTDGLVEVLSERKGDRVLVRIRDDGPGIAAHHLSRIFETFFTTKGPSLGTGLGLSISREIVREYGGDISVESDLGRGATFEVALPASASSP
jgi:signal transduction histidine kinase